MPIRGTLTLTVRADAFEVSHPSILDRAFLGLEYYFKTRDVTIEDSGQRGNRRWIVIKDSSAGRDIELSIRNRNGGSRAIREALIAAGARPADLPIGGIAFR